MDLDFINNINSLVKVITLLFFYDDGSWCIIRDLLICVLCWEWSINFFFFFNDRTISNFMVSILRNYFHQSKLVGSPTNFCNDNKENLF